MIALHRLLLAVAAGGLVVAVAACDSQSDDLVSREIVEQIPWDPPDSWTYALIDDGDKIGTGVLSVEREGDEFVFTQEFAFPDRDITDDVVVRTEADTLFPVTTSRTLDGEDGVRQCDATYDSPIVTVVDESDEGSREDELDYPLPAYDSWMDIFLWATIDFGEGFATPYVDILVCKLAKPDLLGAELEVVGQEEVTVPGGRFDAWHVEYSAGGDTQDLWYTTDDAHTMVRYDSGQLVFELESEP